MKIALLNEFSQSPKNGIILKELKSVAEPMGYQVYNTAMEKPLSDQDVPEAYTKENPRLTYLHLGIQAALLLNSGAADFVVTGCGTGQGALMSLNMYPGVVCGYCIEPTDAYLFLQINNGNALSLPFAKGFGWGAELNLNNIFTRAFGSPKGMGYPEERKEAQNRNANLLFEVKKQVAKPLLEALKSLDPQMVKECMIKRFLDCFYEGCKDEEIKAFVDQMVSEANGN
ncbi:RpiB/LacA/LacB family sugar-phosphate isomerase [Lacrimispora sp.]|uniref:RpiB/LacA/LacB family sugar-phosphate isomerase n=1 Tax=Lacrimispora sp. TaxID=2719234 RepID=UPI002897AEAD|nr:RpiB/LacA/LacB family sugar-phosphate isomerase [Lacrimispora sp.]